MANLFDTPPSHFWRMQPPGGAEHWIVMYHVPNGRCELLPVGRQFAQVTSPSSYQSEPHWSLTQFEVRLRLWQGHDANGKKVEREGRAYTQIRRRALTPEEIAHMKTLIENYRKDMSDATPQLSTPEARKGTHWAEKQTSAAVHEGSDFCGAAPFDRASLTYRVAEEPQRTQRLQKPETEEA